MEEWIAAQIAIGLQLLHKQLEGQILIGISFKRGLAYLGQQRHKSWVATEVRAHDQRIDKEANQTFNLAAVAICDR